jgi:hypothetical protein
LGAFFCGTKCKSIRKWDEKPVLSIVEGSPVQTAKALKKMGAFFVAQNVRQYGNGDEKPVLSTVEGSPVQTAEALKKLGAYFFNQIFNPTVYFVRI